MTHPLPTGRPWDVYGSRISYYTGKLECWLRLYGIDYRILPVGGNVGKLKREAGASQMPVVQMADGRWMTDTTPSEIMRQNAPRVFAWVARMWAIGPQDMAGDLIGAIDAPLDGLLRETCQTNLAQHRQNAAAWSAGESRTALEVQGARYASVPVSRYRVWCLEALRREWAALPAGAQGALKEALQAPEAAILWDDTVFRPSGYDPERKAPFNRAINVFEGGVPGRP